MKIIKNLNTMKICILVGMFLMFSLSACQSTANPTNSPLIGEVGKVVKVDGGAYTDLSVSGLKSLLEKKEFLLVNVHIPFEGNLPNTDLSIPYDTIGQNLEKLPGDKNAKIVLYCRSGSMSTMAAKELVKLGYTNIFNLDGGMAAWEKAGQPIEK
jgi:phage shock protein E